MKIKYSLIHIWWRLTTIIPLRTNEFLRLKRDCFSIEDSTYWINLPRSKRKKRYSRDLEIIGRIQINKSLFDLLNDYCNSTYEFSDCKYLFPYKLYRAFFTHSNIGWSMKNNKDIIAPSQLKIIFDCFYDEVIQKKYSIKPIKKKGLGPGNNFVEIEKFSPMDTRHLAICNAMIQNLSPLTIAQLAGHTQIETQLYYCNHLDTYLQSAVYNLAERLSKERQIKNQISEIEISSLINRSKLAKFTDDLEKYPEIEDGTCTDPEFPEHCTTNCEFCDYYILNLKKRSINFEKLEDLSSMLGFDIQKYLSLLIDVRYKMRFENDKLNNFGASIEQLSAVSQVLKRVTHQKAIIDSYLLEE